jgi:hypothetical protein
VATFGQQHTAFKRQRDQQFSTVLKDHPWSPFEDKDEWELAHFLTKELTQTATDKYLKLLIVSVLIASEKVVVSDPNYWT